MLNSLRRDNRAISTMLIVAVLAVILVAGGIGVYYVLTQSTPASELQPGASTPAASASASASASPSASASASVSASVAPSSSAVSVAGASSLKYSVSVTENGVNQGSYTFWGKNADTNSFMMRIEFSSPDGDGIYIFNAAKREAWIYSDGEWEDVSIVFDMQFDAWNNLWRGYVNSLAGWAGTGDHSYSADGVTVRIYDISVNPSLDDSLFENA